VRGAVITTESLFCPCKDILGHEHRQRLSRLILVRKRSGLHSFAGIEIPVRVGAIKPLAPEWRMATLLVFTACTHDSFERVDGIVFLLSGIRQNSLQIAERRIEFGRLQVIYRQTQRGWARLFRHAACEWLVLQSGSRFAHAWIAAFQVH